MARLSFQNPVTNENTASVVILSDNTNEGREELEDLVTQIGPSGLLAGEDTVEISDDENCATITLFCETPSEAVDVAEQIIPSIEKRLKISINY